MDTIKINQLQTMISQADFLNVETKAIFLDKLPYLPENKLNDLLEIFNNNQAERVKLNLRKKEIFEKYKNNLKEIYQRAKQKAQEIREKAFLQKDADAMQDLELKLKNI